MFNDPASVYIHPDSHMSESHKPFVTVVLESVHSWAGCHIRFLGPSLEEIFHEFAFGFEMVSAADRHKRVLVSRILALGRIWGAGHDRSYGVGGGVSGGRAAATCGGRGGATVPVAMVLTKREEAGNMLRAATAAMADWVVCAGCRRRRE